MAVATFRTDVEVENLKRTGERRLIGNVVVDAGRALSWFPARVLESLGIERMKTWHFRQADGSVLVRWTGEAVVHVGKTSTCDEVVFAEEGDPVLLGARSLAGLNLRVDPVSTRLVDAGPAPAAAA